MVSLSSSEASANQLISKEITPTTTQQPADIDLSTASSPLDDSAESTVIASPEEQDQFLVVLRPKQHDVPNEDVKSPADKVHICAEPFDNEKIECIRSFLESDLVPDEFWQLQRDSFIHRSYNERLLARKNARDTRQRPISLPVDKPQTFKRDSFLRQSLNKITRTFSRNIKHKNNSVDKRNSDDKDGNNNGDNKDSSSNASVTSKGTDNVLQVHPTSKSKKCHSRNNSSSSCTSIR